jgi:predicted DCC family thiol-disulfide oxidoreductase YuxK
LANGWTGGQYSAYRVVLAAAIATRFGVVGWIGAVPLALGAGDRLAACVLLAAGAIAGLAGHARLSAAGAAAGLFLLLHALTPARPYGAWSARGRADPAAGWHLPAGVHGAARAALALAVVLAALGWSESLGALWAPLVLLACDPGWLPAKRAAAPARLFYDGDCGLCHATVRFVLAEDRDGRGFRFAPLASESFARLAPAEVRAALPDSIVLALDDGTLLVRSAAALEIGERLGGLWRACARIAGILPAAALDRLYDAIARNRKRFVRRPDDACPVVSADLRSRFD